MGGQERGRARRDRAAGRRTPTRPTDRFRGDGRHRPCGRIGGSARRRHTRQTMTTRLRPTPPRPLSVALVTLGCARNEVDSEELAGRLEADGFRLVDDPADADTVVVNTCGFVEAAKKDSVDTLLAGRRPQGGRPAPRPWSRSAAWPSGTARSSPTSLPEADAVLGFDDYPDIAARLRSIVAGETHHAAHAAGPAPAAADLAGRARRSRPPAGARVTPSGPGAPYAAASTPARWRRSSWPAAATGAARSARSRASAARSSAAAPPTCSPRRAGWPTQGVARAVPGQRELHVLRQGPRRPPACSRRCCPSWPPSTASSGSGCPTCSRPRPGPGCSRRSRPRRAWRRTSTCPSSTPARRCCAGCAGSATPRASSALLDQVRALAPEAGVRSNVIVGFPGETERRPRDPVRLPGRRAAGRHRRLRLLRRGRHRGGDVRRQARRGRDPRPRRARHRAWSRSSPPSGPRSGSASRSRCSSRRVDGRRRRGPRRPPGPRGRRVDATSCGLPARAVGDMVRAVVVGTEGVDLVARDRGDCR